MPVFDFEGPDGKVHSIEGPEGATKEQAFQILQQHMGGGESANGSSASGIAKSLGTGLAQGALGLAGLPADLAHLYAPNPNDANPLGAAGLQKKVEQYTGDFYKPQGALEETAAKIGQFAPAAIGGPETLAARIGTRVAAPAIGGEIGKQVGGPLGEAAGAIVGGVSAPLAVNKFRQLAALRNAAGTLPSGEELVQKGSNQFDQARAMDVAVKPDFAKNMAQDMRAAVKDYDPEQIKPVLSAIDRVENLYKPNQPNPYNTLQPVKPPPPIEMNEIELVRKQLSSLKTSPDATLRTAAKTAQEVITKNQAGLMAADALKGDAPLYAQTIKDAVANYGAGKRSLIIQGKQDLADLNAATAGSGANIDNNTRQAFKQLARPMNNTNVPVWRKLGFNNAEGAAIEKAATGTTIGNTARLLGKGAPTGIVSAIGGAGLGHMAGGPVGAVALPTAGYIAKKIGDLSTKKAVQALDSLVRSRSPLAAAVAKQLPPQIVSQLPPTSLQRLTLMITKSPGLVDHVNNLRQQPSYQDASTAGNQ